MMIKQLIKEIPKYERPRERLIKYGAKNLSTEELIAIILKTGTKDYSAKFLASEILSRVKDVNDLKNLCLADLVKINGIGPTKAIEFLASIELGRRVYTLKNKNIVKLNSASLIYDYIIGDLENKKQEYFVTIYLDQNKCVIDTKFLFKGTLNKSLVHPREIFKWAYINSAAFIICVHNHPSGNVLPSKEDYEITNALVKISKLQGIPILDHLIVSDFNYYSFYENNELN